MAKRTLPQNSDLSGALTLKEDRILWLRFFIALIRGKRHISQGYLEYVADIIDQMLEVPACRKALGESGQRGRIKNEDRDISIFIEVEMLHRGPKRISYKPTKKHRDGAYEIVAKKYHLSSDRVKGIHKEQKKLFTRTETTPSPKDQVHTLPLNCPFPSPLDQLITGSIKDD